MTLSAAATPLCHFVTSPPQGGRSGARGSDAGSGETASTATGDLDRPCRIAEIASGRERRHVRRLQSPPLWGRCHEVTEGGTLPHTPVPPKARANARRMRKNLTDAELKLWNELRAHRLMGLGFRRQMPVAGYIVDFACPSHDLIVELDGSQDALGQIAAYDAERSKRLQADGWTVLRFWNDDVLKDIDGVCLHILKVLGKDRP